MSGEDLFRVRNFVDYFYNRKIASSISGGKGVFSFSDTLSPFYMQHTTAEEQLAKDIVECNPHASPQEPPVAWEKEIDLALETIQDQSQNYLDWQKLLHIYSDPEIAVNLQSKTGYITEKWLHQLHELIAVKITDLSSRNQVQELRIKGKNIIHLRGY